MNTTSISRGEKVGIPFTITDDRNGLSGVRVTATFGKALDNLTPVLKKTGALLGSSADITITSQTAGAIAGTIIMLPGDYASLFPATIYIGQQPVFYVSLWVDDGSGNDRCVTPGGADMLIVYTDVPRT